MNAPTLGVNLMTPGDVMSSSTTNGVTARAATWGEDNVVGTDNLVRVGGVLSRSIKIGDGKPGGFEEISLDIAVLDEL